MVVCSCNVISDHEVREATARATSGRMSEVYRHLGRTPECGRCKRTISEVARSHQAQMAGP
jgi:bacterioferritin-associated ferredoxin